MDYFRNKDAGILKHSGRFAGKAQTEAEATLTAEASTDPSDPVFQANRIFETWEEFLAAKDRWLRSKAAPGSPELRVLEADKEAASEEWLSARRDYDTNPRRSRGDHNAAAELHSAERQELFNRKRAEEQQRLLVMVAEMRQEKNQRHGGATPPATVDAQAMTAEEFAERLRTEADSAAETLKRATGVLQEAVNAHARDRGNSVLAAEESRAAKEYHTALALHGVAEATLGFAKYDRDASEFDRAHMRVWAAERVTAEAVQELANAQLASRKYAVGGRDYDLVKRRLDNARSQKDAAESVLTDARAAVDAETAAVRETNLAESAAQLTSPALKLLPKWFKR